MRNTYHLHWEAGPICLERCSLSDDLCISLGFEDGVVNRYTQCSSGSQCFEIYAMGGEFEEGKSLFGCMESSDSCESFQDMEQDFGATLHDCQIIPAITGTQGTILFFQLVQTLPLSKGILSRVSWITSQNFSSFSKSLSIYNTLSFLSH